MNFFIPKNDYLSTVSGLPVNGQFTNFILFVIQLYTTIIVITILNMLLLLIASWGLLLIFRMLGIPWVDGTTKGFIDRK
jgi:hypothetical protein